MSDPTPTPTPQRPSVNAAARLRRVEQERAADLARVGPEYRQEVTARLDQNPEAELYQARACDFIRNPVSVETFIYDDRYLGHSLKGNVYPAIVDDLDQTVRGRPPGSLSGRVMGVWGKSCEIEIGIAYEIYLLSCMRQPAAAFGLIPGSTPAFLNVSVDVRQAQRVLFGGLKRCEE